MCPSQVNTFSMLKNIVMYWVLKLHKNINFSDSRSDEGFKGASVNVGLNLKFNKTEQEVPGYTRRNDQGKWIYSLELLEILDAYLTEYYKVYQYSSNNLI